MAFFERIKALLQVGGNDVANGNPVPVSDAGASLTVDGTVAVTNADMASCKTALELIDNSVDGNCLNVNMNLAGTDAAVGNGTAATAMRVSIASDSTGQIKLAAGTAIAGQFGIDQTTDGTTNKVQARNATADNFNVNANNQIGDADVSTSNPIPVSSVGGEPSANFTRANNTTAYTAGDVVGAAVTANISFDNVSSVTAGRFMIVGANLRIDINAIPSGMGSYRLHLYNAAPTAIADNAAYNLPSGDRAKYLGFITIDTPQDLGDTVWAQTDNINFEGKLAAGSTTLYGILTTLAAWTPAASTVFTVMLKVVGV